MSSSTFILRKTAVLGAGVMGAQIAAHLTNAGVETVLFDLAAKEGPKSGIALKAIANLQKLVLSVPVGDYVIDYTTRLVRSTRPKIQGKDNPDAPPFIKQMVDWGAGPRAGQYLISGAQAMAAMDGRFSVALDDIKKVAVPVLRHRIGLNFQAQAEGKTADDLVDMLLKAVPEPEVPKFEKARRKL